MILFTLSKWFFRLYDFLKSIIIQVQIKILEPGEEGSQTASDHERVVRIFGNNADNVQNARTEVEYVEEVRHWDDKGTKKPHRSSKCLTKNVRYGYYPP